MATRLKIDGYGQVELNNCAFRRDGRIEAQCHADQTDFSNAVIENGMILAVDAVASTVKFATDTSLPVALVYSAEHMYDDLKSGLKDFYLKGTDDFLPRLGYLSVGDKFTTNCVSYDSSTYTNDSAFLAAVASFATTALYGAPESDGSIAVSSSAASAGLNMRVIASTTMPDGQPGIKFQVYAV